MKRTIQLLLVLAFSLAVSKSAAGELADTPTKFYSFANGYSISLPAGWVQVPNEAVQQYRTNTLRSPNTGPKYELAFQRDGQSEWFVYPYVIVSITPYPADQQLTDGQITKWIKYTSGASDALLSTTKNELDPDFARRISSGSFAHPQWDNENKIHRMNVKWDVADIGTVRVSATSHVGRHAIVAVACFSADADTDAGIPATFDRINDSFHFDPGWEYDNERDKTTAISPGVEWSFAQIDKDLTVYVWVATILGFLKGCLVLFVLWLLRRLIRSYRGAKVTPEFVVSGNTPAETEQCA